MFFHHGGERRNFSTLLRSVTNDLFINVKGCKVSATFSITSNATFECDTFNCDNCNNFIGTKSIDTCDTNQIPIEYQAKLIQKSKIQEN